jgi:beta-lactam-binding protein with PASTA domain
VEPAKVDSNYPEGFVAEQDPVSGMRVKPGRTIKLSLSAGISELHMPNLVAYKNDATPTTDSYTTLDRARNTLNRMGLVLESTESRFDNAVPKDCVIDQTPAPRTSVKRGTKVVLLISKGPEEATVIVPSFIGSTPTDAGKQLKDLGLTVGTVTEVPRADVPSGRIVNQYPPVGTMLKRGEKVNFEIARNVAPPKPK